MNRFVLAARARKRPADRPASSVDAGAFAALRAAAVHVAAAAVGQRPEWDREGRVVFMEKAFGDAYRRISARAT